VKSTGYNNLPYGNWINEPCGAIHPRYAILNLWEPEDSITDWQES